MQVARAAAAGPASPTGANPPSRTASYAPLYLSSTLGDFSFDLEELEGVSLDRLKVLKAAEAARTAAALAPPGSKLDSIRKATRVAERSHGLNIPPSGPHRADRILKDEASHFLLRLALCRNHEHRTWLLAAECDLFATRLEGTGVDFALSAIRRANGPTVVAAPSADLERYRAELDAVQRGPNRIRAGDGPPKYYKLAFEHVPTLVRQRRVFLRAGFAYVPERHVMDVVAAQFRMKLSAGLNTAAKAGALAEADARMRPILESIREHFAASDSAKKGFDEAQDTDKISLNELKDALPALPLCMAHMMGRLHTNHHLRYAARLQLGVFLKGCGLTLDESLRFWRDEFGKGDMSNEKFEKNYAYNIRHHYGKEGKRRNLTPFACMRVINDRPGPGEHNGCPYREFDEGKLKSTLRAAGVDAVAIPPIVARAKDHNYQVACGLCFTATQPGPHTITEGGIPEYIPNHPNEYFIEARRRRLKPSGLEEAALDDDLDEEEMILAAQAAETQKSQDGDEEDSKEIQKVGEVEPAEGAAQPPVTVKLDKSEPSTAGDAGGSKMDAGGVESNDAGAKGDQTTGKVALGKDNSMALDSCAGADADGVTNAGSGSAKAGNPAMVDIEKEGEKMHASAQGKGRDRAEDTRQAKRPKLNDAER